MDNAKPAAERVRSIIQAMERTIDAVRRERLNIDDEPQSPSRGFDREPTAGVEARSSAPGSVRPAIPPAEGERDRLTVKPGSDDAPRLKARPKRATPFPPVPSETWRSRAS